MYVQSSPGALPRAGGGEVLRLSLVGGFGLWHAAQPIRLPASAQRVVAYLAINERASLRTHVAASLWLDTPEERALANLRSALWRLRRPGLPIVEVSGDQLWLPESIQVDLRDLTRLARGLLDDQAPVRAGVAESLMVAGDLLPGWHDDWVLVERERFRQLRLHALERACADLATAGDFGRAVEACLAAVIEEPLRESAHRGLIAAHLAEGNRVEAIRQFEAYRRLMAEELGLPPSQPIVDLLGGITAGGRDRAAAIEGPTRVWARPPSSRSHGLATIGSSTLRRSPSSSRDPRSGT